MLATTDYPVGRGALRARYVQGLLHVVNTSGATVYTVDPATGNFVWHSAGFPFGSFYGDEIAWSQASMTKDEWYAITDADIVDGPTNMITGDGQGKLTVTYAGKYLAWYSISAEMSGAGNHLKTTFMVNGVAQAVGKQHSHFVTADAEVSISCQAILDLTAGQYVQLGVMNPDVGTPTVTVDHANLTLLQVGG